MKSVPQQVCDDLMVLIDHVKHEVGALAEQQGLTRMQFFVLCSINRNQELPMGKVADAMHCDASNITGIVERLVQLGLVRRQENPTDRRAKTLHLTVKGKKIVDDLAIALPERLGCQAVSVQEQTVLNGIVKKICG